MREIKTATTLLWGLLAGADGYAVDCEAIMGLQKQWREAVAEKTGLETWLRDAILDQNGEEAAMQRNAIEDANTAVMDLEVTIERRNAAFRQHYNFGLSGRLGGNGVDIFRLVQVLETENEADLVSSLDSVISDLTHTLGQTRAFAAMADSEDDDAMRRCLTAATGLKRGLDDLRKAREDRVDAEKALVTFPEADKRELFHNAGSTSSPSQPSGWLPVDLDWRVRAYANGYV